MSFFKRPSWAASASSDKPVRKDFYRRADIFYEKIVASEREEEEGEGEEKKGAKGGKKRKHDDGDDGNQSDADKNDAIITIEEGIDDRQGSKSPQHLSKKPRIRRSLSRSGSKLETKSRSISKSRSRSRSQSRPKEESGAQSPVRETQTVFTFDPDEEFDLESLKKRTRVETPEFTLSRPQSGVICEPQDDPEEGREQDDDDDDPDYVEYGHDDVHENGNGGAAAEGDSIINIPSSPEIAAAASPENTIPQNNDEEEDDYDYGSESDEELRKLMRTAHERAKRGRESNSLSRSNSTGLPTHTETEEDQQILHIYITSPIPNSDPLLVHRRMAQNLGDVRKAWCDKNGFPPEMKARVFLTWKDKRVFDATTCRSLGIKKDLQIPDELLSDDEFVPDENVVYVHMIAYTPELWEEYREKKQRWIEGEPDDLEDVEEEEEQRAPEPTKRIEIRAAGMPAFTMKITARSTVSDAIQAFKKAKKLSDTSEVVLLFDGDILHPDDEFESLDIEDEDMIDARVQ